VRPNNADAFDLIDARDALNAWSVLAGQRRPRYRDACWTWPQPVQASRYL